MGGVYPTQSVPGQVQVQAGSRPRVCSGVVWRQGSCTVGGRGERQPKRSVAVERMIPRAFFQADASATSQSQVRRSLSFVLLLLMPRCLLLLLACTAARTVGCRSSWYRPYSFFVQVLQVSRPHSANTTEEEEDKQGPGRHATSTWAWGWGT
ncbi:hypothetical protein QBC32DRAFT_81935 [Pseudoneurospora amorphoporcata]|uniref:Uncharacterized protein n=1 Tax=Pseudoneurospora amorphoporcata TaxID=241081 RepID=A0AAN6NYP9_9PEZI|nr:hypothetical protein QBC32DRAFT_81935 [Pseudoneurospora amorphoporcata]